MKASFETIIDWFNCLVLENYSTLQNFYEATTWQTYNAIIASIH